MIEVNEVEDDELEPIPELDMEPTEKVWTVAIPSGVRKHEIETIMERLRAFPAERRSWFIHESDEPNFEDAHYGDLLALGATISMERMVTPGALRLVQGESA